MKMKNRKGSTLIMTLLVFVVLMIFGTFTLSFMVNENKMSLNHQYKTQAYYIARSGAVAVEAAIMDLNKLEVKEGNFVSIDKNFIVLSDKNSKMEKPYDYKPNEYPINLKPGNENLSKINDEVIYINEEDNKYDNYDFTKAIGYSDTPATKVPDDMKFGIGGDVTDYVFDNLIITKKVKVKGKVNIYVKGIVEIKSGAIMTKKNKDEDEFNIYILPDTNGDKTKLIYNGAGLFESNIYIGSGRVDIYLHNSNLDSNIISNGSEVYLYTQTGGKDHQIINGNIYAPNAIVRMDINALMLNGFIVSNYLQLYERNGKDFKGDKKLTLKEGINQELEEDGRMQIKSGYFK